MKSTRIVLTVAACAAAVSGFLIQSGSDTGRTPATGAEIATTPRSLPSRLTDQDERGFYFAPAALADDYPEESTTEAKIRRDFETLKATGARHLRFGIGWDSIEKEPGKYDWSFWDRFFKLAAEYEITLIPYVCYTPEWAGKDKKDFWKSPPRDAKSFGRFMHAIASRYRGQVPSWELWNEPDILDYWTGTADQFAKMVTEGAREVRRADPAAKIVLGGMAKPAEPFLKELFEKHRIAELVDIINVHGYHETWNPARAEAYPDVLQKVRDLAATVSPARDVWLAEFGYSDYRHSANQTSVWGIDVYFDYEHSPSYQAAALWKHHVLAAASEDVSLMAWYRINDLPSDETVIGDANNRHLGLLTADGAPKPAYHAFRFYNAFFDEPVRPITSTVTVTGATGAPDEVVHVFEEADGDVLVTSWIRSALPGEVKDRSGFVRDTRRETVSLHLPLKKGARRLVVHDVSGKELKSSSAVLSPEGILSGVQLRGERPFIAEIKAPVN